MAVAAGFSSFPHPSKDKLRMTIPIVPTANMSGKVDLPLAIILVIITTAQARVLQLLDKD
jgi:hypothetical protein